MWVGIDDGLCFCACQLYNLSVSCNIGYLQVESHSALLGSFQIARSSELEIGFGDAESIVRITHDINAFAGFLRQLIVGDASYPGGWLPTGWLFCRWPVVGQSSF